LINLSINGEEISVEEGTTILEAAKKLNYKIPTLCYQKELSVYGGCRLCIVDIKGENNYAISCATEVQNGMVVHTHTRDLMEVRKNIFQLIIANHPFDCKLNCLTCIKNISCELRKLAEEIGVTDLQYEFIEKEWKTDKSSVAIEIETSKCVTCGRCIRTCDEIQYTGVLTMTNRGPATKVSTFLDKGLGNVDCVSCGQCILACPTGAIHEVISLNKVINEINNPEKHVVVQTAPAVRVAIGEEFGYWPGKNLEAQMVTALKKIGFDKVFDTNFTADLTIIEEANEFIKRFTNNERLPLITSCSPGWINFAEYQIHDVVDNLSSCKSPQQMFGALSKSYYSEKTGIKKENIVSVSIMPCTAKKYEAKREEMKSDNIYDVDYVITTREFAKLIKQNSIDFANLSNGTYDNPFGISTGASVIFGASGGVMEAALRTAYHSLTGENIKEIEFHQVRGLNGIKEAVINIGEKQIKVAVANGLENAYQLMKRRNQYHFIEIMACPGGCIGGGGQPISCVEDYLEKRKNGLYQIDEEREIRFSHENPAIKRLYDEFLKEPLSEISEKYLHTSYKKRKE